MIKGLVSADTPNNKFCLKLRSYIEKLTGPFLDRFAILYITEKQKLDFNVSLSEIKKNIESAQNFQIQTRQQKVVNQKLEVSILLEQLDSEIIKDLLPYSKSHRRRQSLLRVARSIADLEKNDKIKQEHLEEAQRWTSHDMYKLERFRIEDFAKL